MWRAQMYRYALQAALGQGGGPMDLLSDTLKMSIHDSSSNVPDWPSIFSWDDITGEVSASGYSAGGATVSGKTLTYDATYRLIKFSITPPPDIYEGGGDGGDNALADARWAVIYDNTATGKPPIAYVDFSTEIGAPEMGTADGWYQTVMWPVIFELQTYSSSNGHWYGQAWINIFGGGSSGEARQTDWLLDDIKVSLHTSDYIVQLDTDEVFADTSDELSSGDGYTTGGMSLTGKSISYETGGFYPEALILNCDDIRFTALTKDDIKYAVIYNDTPGDKPLLGLIDLAGVSCVNEDLLIQWNRSSGILSVRHFAL